MEKTLIQTIFNRNSREITIEDVIDYFKTEREETAVVEFKSGEVAIEDLYKEITAFLNTEGGLIIVGSPREQPNKKGKTKGKVCQGDLVYSKFRSKDWLYQKVASYITPTPTNLNIVEVAGSQGTVYLIEVPQSSRPPHQANSDGRYYLRLESEAKPAPHGIVQALFDKRRKSQFHSRTHQIFQLIKSEY